MRRTNTQLEFGDFQTPRRLADRVCAYLAGEGIRPVSIVEPTCGTGTFILSALKAFPDTRSVLGVEINPAYLATAKARIRESELDRRVELLGQDFFDLDWPRALGALLDPILVIGNPPWITIARVASLAGSNVPTKSNFMGLSGMDAKTGKSNFDITEWMLLRLWECLKDRDACFALLMKTSVARRILQYIWSTSASGCEARLLPINAKELFDAGADAALLLLRTQSKGKEVCCSVSSLEDWRITRTTFGMRGNTLAADVAAFDRTHHLRSAHPLQQALRWRSGVKHDCARVLQLTKNGSDLFNQLGETVDVEREWVFPLLKGSSIANGNVDIGAASGRFVIVPQRSTGEDTTKLAGVAPRLWCYLTNHREIFAKRRSSIYKERPPFAVFGIGSYTFQPWKVAICGLYKHLTFALVAPHGSRPVVLDDTSYHLSFDCEDEARFVLELLNSTQARDFYSARVFWDAKRPITAGLLQQLDLLRLAHELGRIKEWDRLTRHDTLFDAIASCADAKDHHR